MKYQASGLLGRKIEAAPQARVDLGPADLEDRGQNPPKSPSRAATPANAPTIELPDIAFVFLATGRTIQNERLSRRLPLSSGFNQNMLDQLFLAAQRAPPATLLFPLGQCKTGRPSSKGFLQQNLLRQVIASPGLAIPGVAAHDRTCIFF